MRWFVDAGGEETIEFGEYPQEQAPENAFWWSPKFQALIRLEPTLQHWWQAEKADMCYNNPRSHRPDYNRY